MTSLSQYTACLTSALPRLFARLFSLLLCVLPFHVILSVFFEYKLGFAGFTLYKELILILMGGIVAWGLYTRRIAYNCSWIDGAIVVYGLYLVGVSLFYPYALEHIIYWGRYNFEFLGAFLILRFGATFLPERAGYYLRLFLISGSAALVIGMLVRWIFGEQVLLHFGYSPQLSNWNFGGSIPIYHGIDGANVRRFQGIFDGPNPAWFFIILYIGVMISYFKSAKKYYYLLSLWGILLLGVLFYTYSRSALIGFAISLLAMVAMVARGLWTRHRWAFAVGFLVLLSIGWLFYLKFEGNIDRIILREGSTKGHYDRAVTGIKRAIERPQGSGLASAGPAYRFVKQPEPTEWLFEWVNKMNEDYYIPESWFIQQAVEGGVVGFVLFVSIFIGIAARLARRNIAIFGSFLGMGAMNLFLHSYESLYISLLLFMIVGLLLRADDPTQHA